MKPDYDDPEVEESWCLERKEEVAAYLEREGLAHGQIGEWPAWHLAPYVSVWAIESKAQDGRLGWWVICGDLPTDYVSASTLKTPQDAVRSIARRWLEASELMERGEQPPTFTVGSEDHAKELAPMLQSRASLLLDWSDDDSLWESP